MATIEGGHIAAGSTGVDPATHTVAGIGALTGRPERADTRAVLDRAKLGLVGVGAVG